MSLKHYLDGLVDEYERASFIATDPISIPHGFDDPRDQEVIGLYAALLAWGQRTTMLAKLEDLCERMRYRPYEFVRSYADGADHDRLAGFVHRTFQPIDAHWFTILLSIGLERYGSINAMFLEFMAPDDRDIGPAIDGFSSTLLTLHSDTPHRLRKHLARPSAGSACKRLVMYLRWMVRSGPVDLGIWTGISPSQLMLPLDVHSRRHAQRCGLLTRRANDWKAVVELTEKCRTLCEDDPARYDFALYGPGAFGNVEPVPPELLTPDGVS